MKAFPKKKLPDTPGVYFFLGRPKRDEGGKKGRAILYIGKATSLRDRVKSYFGKDLIDTRGPLIVKMVEEASSIAVQKTDSVLEALILEAALIKRHQPHYNTKEKSDTSFNYAVLTDETFPRLFTVRERELVTRRDDFKAVYGPFPNGTQLRDALKLIRKIFPYRGENDAPLPNQKRRASRLYEEIGLAPNLTGVDAKEYAKTIRQLMLFFEGKKQQLITLLKRDMKAAAKARDFEFAQEMKRRLFALQHIQDIALIKTTEGSRVDAFRIEAYDVAHIQEKNRVGVFTVVESGEVNRREYRMFKIQGTYGAGDTGGLREILERRFAHPEWPAPKLIVVDGSTAQIRVAESVLKELGYKIPVIAVTKNERHRPERLVGNTKLVAEHERAILLANHEAHRFAIAFHRKRRSRTTYMA